MGDKAEAQKSAELWRFLPKAWKPYFNVRDPQEIQRRAEAEIPLDQILEDMTIGPDSEMHVQKLHEAFQAAQPRCTFTPASRTSER